MPSRGRQAVFEAPSCAIRVSLVQGSDHHSIPAQPGSQPSQILAAEYTPTGLGEALGEMLAVRDWEEKVGEERR